MTRQQQPRQQQLVCVCGTHTYLGLHTLHVPQHHIITALGPRGNISLTIRMSGCVCACFLYHNTCGVVVLWWLVVSEIAAVWRVGGATCHMTALHNIAHSA